MILVYDAVFLRRLHPMAVVAAWLNARFEPIQHFKSRGGFCQISGRVMTM